MDLYVWHQDREYNLAIVRNCDSANWQIGFYTSKDLCSLAEHIVLDSIEENPGETPELINNLYATAGFCTLPPEYISKLFFNIHPYRPLAENELKVLLQLQNKIFQRAREELGGHRGLHLAAALEDMVIKMKESGELPD